MALSLEIRHGAFFSPSLRISLADPPARHHALTQNNSHPVCFVCAQPTSAQCASAAAIDAACRAHGFLYLTNLGAISPSLVQRAFDASRDLFALPDEVKLGLPRCCPETNSGFAPFGSERLNRRRGPDQKEAFNVRRPQNAPDGALSGTPAAFSEAAIELWAALEKVSQRYCLACALALGVERDFFAKTFVNLDLCTVRFLHYPPTQWPAAGAAADAALDGSAGCAVRVSEHTDFGMFTILLLGGGADGLQIKPVLGGDIGGTAGGEAGGWRDVVTPAGVPGAVINTGALLARWTNDVWRATAHRVIVPTAQIADTDRYSIACFLDPDSDAVIQPHESFASGGGEDGQERGVRYGPVTGKEFLLMKLRQIPD